MIRGLISKDQLQIGKDIRMKLQTSPSVHLNFNISEKNLLLIGAIGELWYGTPTWFKAGAVSGSGRIVD